VFEGPWSFTDDGWVLAGLVLFVGIFALGLGTIVPAGKKLTALAPRARPDRKWTSRSGGCGC
jgi:hypothetical protein